VVRPCGILGGAFLPPTKEELFARQHQIKELAWMRLKLVVIVSLLAAIVGAGSCIALVLGIFSLRALSNPGLLVASTFLLPLAAIIFASIFVYRHTARRRRLQAFLTVVLATLLTLALFIVASILSARRNPSEPAQPAGPHIAS
jgi:purine-cytosine permease-like protein